MKGLIAVHIGLLLLLLACTAPQVDTGAAGPVLKPGDLGLEITLDEEPRPAALTDGVERDLQLTLTRKTGRGLKGALRLGLPAGMESDGKARVFAFDLTKSETAAFRTKLSIPEGVGGVQLTYPIEITVGDQTYLTMDLIVVKAVAWEVPEPLAYRPPVWAV